MVQHFSNSIINNNKQASKIWPLARGFLPYIKEKEKITKATNINISIIEEHF
jgi:hypothetical protein